jgi:hypothetical protein
MAPARRFIDTWGEKLLAEDSRWLADSMRPPFAYGGFKWQWMSIDMVVVDDENNARASKCQKDFGAAGTVTAARLRAFVSCLQYGAIGGTLSPHTEWSIVTIDKLHDRFASQRKAIAAAAKGRLLVSGHRDAGGGLDYRTLFILDGDADKPKLAGMFVALP